MAFDPVLPIQNRSGAFQSPSGAVPPGMAMVRVRIDLAAPGATNDFLDPTQAILLRIEWSRDNQATWINTGDMALYGNPLRQWGRSQSPAGLFIGQEVPQGIYYPTHVRAGYALVGTVRFGISLEAVPA